MKKRPTAKGRDRIVDVETTIFRDGSPAGQAIKDCMKLSELLKELDREHRLPPRSPRAAIRKMQALGRAMLELEATATKQGALGLVVVVVDPDGFTTTIHRLFDKSGGLEERRMRSQRVAAAAGGSLTRHITHRADREREKGTTQ